MRLVKACHDDGLSHALLVFDLTIDGGRFGDVAALDNEAGEGVANAKFEGSAFL